MMIGRKWDLWVGLFILAVLPGCQCYRGTAIYSAIIDAYADTKLRLDPLYEPGLDVSRIGMPDWNEFGVNRWLCPCADGRCCRRCSQKVYYPAEYRMKYWNHMAEKQKSEQLKAQPQASPENQSFPVEETPLPVPDPLD